MQRFRGFLLFVLVTLSSSKVGTVGDRGPRSPLVESVRSFSLQYVRCIFIYIYNTVLLLHFVIEPRGRYKRKAAHNTERLQTANTIAQLEMLPILDFSSEISFLLVLIFINSQLTHLERYGLS